MKKHYLLNEIMIGASNKAFGFFPFIYPNLTKRKTQKYQLLWERYALLMADETHGHNLYCNSGVLVKDTNDTIYYIANYDRIFGDNATHDNNRETILQATKFYPAFESFKPNQAIDLESLTSLGELVRAGIVDTTRIALSLKEVDVIIQQLMEKYHYSINSENNSYMNELETLWQKSKIRR